MAQLNTREDFRKRFGKADAQHYMIAEKAQLSVDYDVSGTLAAAWIAPPTYDPRAAQEGEGVDEKVVNDALEILAPGITEPGRGTTMAELMSRLTHVRKVYKGCELSQHLTGSSTQSVTITTKTRCPEDGSRQVSTFLEDRYGPPGYERFLAEGNVEVAGVFDRDGNLKTLDLFARKVGRAGPFDKPIMSNVAAERLVNEVAPPEQLVGAKKSKQHHGAFRQEWLTTDHRIVIRYFDDNVPNRILIVFR